MLLIHQRIDGVGNKGIGNVDMPLLITLPPDTSFNLGTFSRIPAEHTIIEGKRITV